MTVVLVALWAWAAYSLWRASSRSRITIARTAIGVYRAWSTWSSSDAYAALGRLVADERVYLSDLYDSDEATRTLVRDSANGRGPYVSPSAQQTPRPLSAAPGTTSGRHRFDDDFGRGILARHVS